MSLYLCEWESVYVPIIGSSSCMGYATFYMGSSIPYIIDAYFAFLQEC